MLCAFSRHCFGALIAVMAAHFALCTSCLEAQAQPAGADRTWADIGVAFAQQSNRCARCEGTQTGGGPALTAAIGRTLTNGLGVALTGLAFRQLSFETSFRSEYVAALGQYTPSFLPVLTVSAGAGWVAHEGEVSAGLGIGNGSVVVGSAALRLPPTSTFAVSLAASVLQSVDGIPHPYHRLVSFGIALGLASEPSLSSVPLRSDASTTAASRSRRQRVFRRWS